MDASPREKRRKARKTAKSPRILRIGVKDGLGHVRWLTADVTDYSSAGAGLLLARPLEVGRGIDIQAGGEYPGGRARVVWCREQNDGSYTAGVDFVEDAAAGGKDRQKTASGDPENDFYEVMQLSPNADMETIHRVYRLLAQRYHPDNTSSGNEAMFLRLSEAFSVLSDPALRAAYDARHAEMRKVRRKIFGELETGAGAAAERKKRQAVLELLYARLLHDFDHPTLTIHEMEEMLGCPREHLQTPLWFLKGKGYLQRSDNGRYALTVEGFEQAERDAPAPVPESLRGRLLTEGNGPAAV